MINQYDCMGSKDTRSRIILAAMELFSAKGYSSTSVADILSRSQVNSGSLYHYFPGKQDVLIAVLHAYRDGIHPMLLAPAWESVADPIERVFALLDRYRMLIVDSDCEYGCPIGSLALEIHEPDPPVREALAANFRAWAVAVRECLIDAGQRLPTGTDVDALAEFTLTVMEGGVMLARTHREIGFFDRSIAQLRQHYDHLQTMAEAA